VSKRIDIISVSGIEDFSKRIAGGTQNSISRIDDVSRRFDRLTDYNNNNTSHNISKRIVQISDCTDIYLHSQSGAESNGTEMGKVASANKSQSSCTEICKRIDASDCTGMSAG